MLPTSFLAGGGDADLAGDAGASFFELNVDRTAPSKIVFSISARQPMPSAIA